MRHILTALVAFALLGAVAFASHHRADASTAAAMPNDN